MSEDTEVLYPREELCCDRFLIYSNKKYDEEEKERTNDSSVFVSTQTEGVAMAGCVATPFRPASSSKWDRRP